MKKLHIFISGRVQGVGFRHFTRKNAQDLNIEGWVKNLPDGRVEIQAQGEPSKVEEFLEKLESGPISARVDDIEKKEIKKMQNTDGFDVLH